MYVLLHSSAHLRRRSLQALLKQCSNDSSRLPIRCLCGQGLEDQRDGRYAASVSHRSRHRFWTDFHGGGNDHLATFGLLTPPALNIPLLRTISMSSIRFDSEPLKPSSKVEVSVQEIKKQQEQLPVTGSEQPKLPAKKTIMQRVRDEIVHYYHGFRLLFIDIRISSGLAVQILRGRTLTRREYRLLTRTVGDMFRLLPFSVFIIVPFMEFLLPVFLKLFPGMLPSTFQSASEKENKLKQNLKVKLEMAKFLQKTLDDMAVEHKDRSSQQAKEFNEWFQKIRTTGSQVTSKDIMKYSKLFEDQITLDSLSRSQLVALCRVLEVQTLGTNNFLRFQLQMKLRSLAADDKMIQKEGLTSLTLAELQAACRARGMRAYGVSEQRLQQQLAQWLDLSLNEKVPPSLLLLSRALMLPETIPTSDKLKATISALPETIVTQTKVAIGEKEGKIDNQAMLQAIREEAKKVKEERKELGEQEKKEEKEKLVDKAPVVKDTTEPMIDVAKVILDDKIVTPEIPKAAEQPSVVPQPEQLQAKDVKAIEEALVNISMEKKKLLVEKEQIEDLKEQMADYKEDVEDLQKVQAGAPKPAVRESKGAKRLFKSVHNMINKLDHVMKELEDKEKRLKRDLETKMTDETKQELLQIDDIMLAIRKIQHQHLPDDSREQKIQNLLKKLDSDYDGSVKVDHVLKVIELVGKENINLNEKQVDELISLLEKEEILEVEDKIEKALQKAVDDKHPPKKPPSQQPPPPSAPSSPAPQDVKAQAQTCKDPVAPAGTTVPPPSTPKTSAQLGTEKKAKTEKAQKVENR